MRLTMRIWEAFAIRPDPYSLTQPRYDVRKLRAHGLFEREGRSNCYRLTTKGVKVFHHRPSHTNTPPAKIETAYHKADVAIQHLIDLLAA